jgi:3-methyladenine DNA glycosylase/8-oxoguanine DNA glycosylase
MAARESLADIKKRAGRVSRGLAKLYPKARISLDFETPWQCLAATILSAQSTDAGVNRVTPQLFKEYPDARPMIPDRPAPYTKIAGAPRRIPTASTIVAAGTSRRLRCTFSSRYASDAR